MSTVEKLIMQIFERKNWIVEQLKHQIILYDQHLASKCLLDGIAPPPWLWSSSFQPQTSDPSELKKEELIYGLLLSLPHPAAHYTGSRCSLYEKPAVTADNGGSCKEVPAFREGFDARDGLSVLPQIPDIGAGCASSGAPDQDPSVTSPEEFRDSRISGNYNEVALPLSTVQRSRVRQRALELRNSAQATKSNPCDQRGVGGEEYSLNGTFGPAMKKQMLGTSPDKIRVAQLHSADLPEKVASVSHQGRKYDPSMRMSLLEVQDVFCNNDKVPQCSTEAHEECGDKASGQKTGGRCTRNGNNSFCPRSSEHQFSTNSIHAKHSWPQKKRRKLDGQPSLRHSTSLSLRVDDVLQSNVIESLTGEMNQNVECLLSERAESSYQQQVEKDEHGLQEKDESLHASFTLMHEKLEQSLVSGTTKLPNGYSEDRLLEDTKGADPTGVHSDAMRDSQLLLHVDDELELANKENNTVSQNSMEEREILPPGNGKSLSNAIDSPCGKSVDLIDTDHIMPELEGFIVRTFDEELSITGDGIGIDKLDVPTTTLELNGTFSPAMKKQKLSTSPDKIRVALLHSADLPEKVASASHQGKKYDPSMPMSLHKVHDVFCNKDMVPRCSTEAHEECGENASGQQTRERCTSNGNNSFCPSSSEHQFSTNSIHAEHSWTRSKRRKLDGQLSLRLSASLGLRVDDELQSNVSESLICEMNQNVECHLSERAESSYQRQVEKDEHGFEEKDESLHASFTLMHEKQGQSLVSGSSKLPNGYSEDSLLEDTKGTDPTGFLSDAIRELKNEDSQLPLHVEDKLDLVNKENNTASKNSTEEREILLPENGKSLSNSVHSPCRKPVDLIVTHQIIPESEGFIVQTFEEESSTAGEGISIDKLGLLTTTFERVSILEWLCKSACLNTSLSELSATCKLNRPTNLTQSIPNGLLEGMHLRSTFSIDDDTSKEVEASYSCMNKDANHTDNGESHSNYLPFSAAQSTCDIMIPYSSPVSKLWNGTTPKSGSSEKRGSLNIELPCISEETDNVDDVADPSEEAFAKEVATTSVRREPLADLAENLNAPAAVSEAEIFPDRCRLDSVHTEFSFTGTFNRAQQKLGNHDSSKRSYGNNAKENQNMLIGANGLRRATESLNKGFSKPKFSGQTSLEKGGLSFSKTGSKHNNIVSNITSFIPLVQQKQPAGIITGKRDVIVKALEAAEGAKRLAEKKENERRMKREALKHERARVEQENLRQLDLQKKMKEEERKKKEDDMAARKRQREDDEMKEKEKKRRRAEEAQGQQRKRVENLRAKKEEKQKKFKNKDERSPCKKKSDNDSRKLEKRVHAHENCENVSQAEPSNVRTSMRDARKANIVLEECESTSGRGYDMKILNDIGKVVENDQSIPSITYDESYGISPYKGSDDEDEEEEDLPNRKFIPSWASNHSVALAVSSQRRVDPAEIFPTESFCNIAEVLLPRKHQLR